MMLAIQFHNTIDGICTGKGKGNISIEVKLLQKLAAMREEVLYEILFYLHKVYDTLYHRNCFDILMPYVIVPHVIRILRQYLDRPSIFSLEGGYCVSPLKVQCGVTQGDSLHPMIFNVVVDAVIYHWVSMVVEA